MDRDVTVSIILLLVLASFVTLMRPRGPNRRALARLAAGVNRMRAMAALESKYHPVPDAQAADSPLAKYYVDETAEIQNCHCHLLGDLAEERTDGSLTPPTRWFVDDTGTICGWFGVVEGRLGAPVREVVSVFSEGPGGVFYTTNRGGATMGTADPPDHHRAQCAWSDGLARQLEIQRTQVPADARATLTHVATADEATALLGRLRKSKADWRAKQPADALLDLDLRHILQDRYETLGPALLAYMKAHPAAS